MTLWSISYPTVRISAVAPITSGRPVLLYLGVRLNPEFTRPRCRIVPLGSTPVDRRPYHDLLRQGFTGVGFELDAQLDSESGGLVAPILATANSGNRFIIALSGPLTSGHPADPAIAEYRDNGGTIPVMVENELVVRGNLPSVTNVVRHAIED